MMREIKEADTFCPGNKAQWRDWLMVNHVDRYSIWLVCYKRRSGVPSLTHSEAVDEALCFGWIDGTRVKLDEDRFLQFFCKRKPNGTWSKVNKIKVENLLAEGLIMKAGLECIEAAKQNGSWNLLDEVEELVIPKDLSKAFRNHAGSETYFMSLSPSNRKAILQWLVFAKRPETRLKRINEIAELAAQKKKPGKF